LLDVLAAFLTAAGGLDLATMSTLTLKPVFNKGVAMNMAIRRGTRVLTVLSGELE